MYAPFRSQRHLQDHVLPQAGHQLLNERRDTCEYFWTMLTVFLRNTPA